MTFKKSYILLLLPFLVLMNTGVHAQTIISGASGEQPTAATLDADRNIYSVQGIETIDVGNGPETIKKVIKFTASSGYSNSTIINSGLELHETGSSYMSDIEAASNGDLYVVNPFDDDINFYGEVLHLDASDGYSSTPVPLMETTYPYPTAIGIDTNDDLYVVEYDGSSDYQLVKYDVSNGYSSTVLYNGLGIGDLYPRGLTVDPDGNVYVLTDWTIDGANGKILKLSYPGYSVSTVDQGKYFSGLAADANGDLFAMAHINSTTYEVLKYTNGSGSPVTEYGTLTRAGDSQVPLGLGANLSLLDLVIPDPWASSGGRLIYLDKSDVQPTVTTSSAPAEVDISATSAPLGGDVTDDGGSNLTGRGIVWNTTGGPDIDNDNVVAMSIGIGTFSQTVNLLPFGTTIYYRAYATNGEGTAYGSEVSFDTDSEVSVDLTGSEGWRLLSVPAAVNLSTFLDPIWTQGVTTGGDTDFGTPNVYTWNLSSTDNDHTQWWDEVTDLTGTTLPAGQGLLVYVYEDPDYTGPTTPGLASQVLTVNSSEHSAPVSSPPLNANLSGWSLLGNPFGVPVQWDELALSDVEDAIYVWDPNVDSWDGGQGNQDSGSWITRAGGTGQFDGVIHPFQGFFVQNSASGTPGISMEQQDKVTDTATFYGKEPSDHQVVALELSGQGLVNTTWLRFSPDGSTEPAEGEAWELQPLSQNYALLATQKTDGSLVDIGHYPQSAELEIPLVTEATQTGSYAITVTDFEAPGQSLYLNDLQTGESIRLEKDTRYEFMMEQAAKAPADPFAILRGGLKKQATDGHRFVISSSALENPVETPQQFTLEQNYPNPFNPSTVISYQLPVNSDVRLEVFDLSGRQIATLINTRQTAGNYSVNFDGSDLSSGVYMYRLQANGISFTKKLTLIK